MAAAKVLKRFIWVYGVSSHECKLGERLELADQSDPDTCTGHGIIRKLDHEQNRAWVELVDEEELRDETLH